MKITTEWLEKNRACAGAIKWFGEQFETDAKKIITNLIDQYEFNFANWMVNKLSTEKNGFEYLIHIAKLTLPIFEHNFPNDDRPRKAIKAAESGKNCKVAAENAQNSASDCVRELYIAAWAAALAARAARAVHVNSSLTQKIINFWRRIYVNKRIA